MAAIQSAIRPAIRSAIGSAFIGSTAPASLAEQVVAQFAAGEPGLIYDNSRLDLMWQDAAKTTPAVFGQPVGYQNDLSGRGNHRHQPTAANRPILRQDANGKYYLERNGTSQWMVSVAAMDLSALDRLVCVLGARKESDALQQVLYEFGPNATTTNGTFCLYAPRNGTGLDVSPISRGTTSIQTTAPRASPSTFVATTIQQISSPAVVQLRLDGVQVASNSTSQGTGNYSSQLMYWGARAGTSGFATGREYGAVLRAGVNSADQVSLFEAYMMSLTGQS